MTHCIYSKEHRNAMDTEVHNATSYYLPHFTCTVYNHFQTLTLTRANAVVQTKFGGTVMGESAMVNTSDVGSLVEFTFNVSHLHHSDYIRPPGLYIASTICVLLTHISLIPTLSLKPRLLFLRSLILRGEGIVMWAMVCGVSMTRGGYNLGVTKSQSGPDYYFIPSVWFLLKFPFFCAAEFFHH